MDDATLQALAILGALGLVLLNGFFVAAEFAIVKVRATRVRELVKEGHRRARVAQHIIEHLDAYLSATQLGITLASIGLGWIGEPAVARLLGPILQWLGVTKPAVVHGASFAVAFAAISFVHIVLGELAPKSLAIRMPEATSLWVALPLRLFYWVMYPAIFALNGTANALLRLAGIQPASETETAHSPEELRMIVTASHAHGALNATERRLLENVIDFSERRVSEILVPRTEMVCLYTTRSLQQNLDIVREHAHTRYPLALQDKDHIIGLIHVKDLFNALREHGEEGFNLQSVKRDILLVPENISIDRMLRTFQSTRSHMAVAVDEYGGVAGIVTLDDVLQMIVGPIFDEFDIVEAPITRRGNNLWIVDGLASLEELSRALQIPLPPHADIHTAGGYVAHLLGRLPVKGDSIQIDPYRAEVARMDGTRVAELRFHRLNQPSPPQA
ncbi:MAG TPA: hemolysin family protein [Phycisphaeraceae bacterium]